MSHLNFYPNLSVFEFLCQKWHIDFWHENAMLKYLIWLIFKLCFEDHEFYEVVGGSHIMIFPLSSVVYM